MKTPGSSRRYIASNNKKTGRAPLKKRDHDRSFLYPPDIVTPTYLDEEDADRDAEMIMHATLNGRVSLDGTVYDEFGTPIVRRKTNFDYSSCSSTNQYDRSFPTIASSTPKTSIKGYTLDNSMLGNTGVSAIGIQNPPPTAGPSSAASTSKEAQALPNPKKKSRVTIATASLSKINRPLKFIDNNKKAEPPKKNVLRLRYVDIDITPEGYRVGDHPVSDDVLNFIKENEEFQKIVAKWHKFFPGNEKHEVIVPDWPPEIMGKIMKDVNIFIDGKCGSLNPYLALRCTQMGANLQKTLNKKVQFVLFEEGKNSTYIKAKKNGAKLIKWEWVYQSLLRARMQDPDEFAVPAEELKPYEELDPELFRYKLNKIETIERKTRKAVKKCLMDGLITRDNPVLAPWMPRATSLPTNPGRVQARKTNSCRKRGCPKKLKFEEENPQASTSKMKVDQVEHQPEQDPTPSSKGPLDLIFNRMKAKETREPPPTPSEMEVIVIDDDSIEAIPNADNPDKESAPGCSRAKKPEENDNQPPLEADTEERDVDSPAGGCSFELSLTEQNKSHLGETSLLCVPLKRIEDSASSSTLSIFTPVTRHRRMLRSNPTLVFTSVGSDVGRKIKEAVNTLGHFNLEDGVSRRTTHLVTTSSCRRTMNLMKALMRGCWILSVDWVEQSMVAEFWLGEEEFELKGLCAAVLPCRLERQAFGRTLGCYSSHIFENIGKVIIDVGCQKCNDLKEILELGGAEVIKSAKSADLIIGGEASPQDTVPRVTQKWIMDCVTRNVLLKVDKYLVR